MPAPIDLGPALKVIASFGPDVALLPHFQAAPFVAARQLTSVLAGWSRPAVEVYAVLPSRKLTPSAVREFMAIASLGMKAIT